jgi:anti-sigma B factor antagonist
MPLSPDAPRRYPAEVMSAAGPPAFRLSTSEHDGVHVLAPEGELDLATAPQLAEAFGDDPTVLDLGGVEFIDSTGLATLISERQRRQQHGSAFVLVRGSATTQRLFAVTGVEELFAWATTAEEAVARARDGRE